VEKDQPALTKTCSICGQLKPLAAFLQMSATSGTEYGSVCSDCRKKGADKPRVPESDESTKSSSGAVIDSKSKMQADLDKQEKHAQTEEDYYEEREAAETESKQDQTKIERKTEAEKQHRQTFLDRSMLSGKKQPPTTESRWRTEQVTSNLEKVAKEEFLEKGVDQSSTEDLRHGVKEKHKGVAFQQGAAFQHFAARLGKSSTFAASSTEKSASSESIAESIEKSWGPSRKK
jgi:hypothetical protein